MIHPSLLLHPIYLTNIKYPMMHSENKEDRKKFAELALANMNMLVYRMLQEFKTEEVIIIIVLA